MIEKLKRLVLSCLLGVMCLTATVMADTESAPPPSLDNFTIRTSNGTGAGKVKDSDGKAISLDANNPDEATQPVNYWYWVSVPGVSVQYNSKENQLLYFDSQWRGLFMTPIGNGDYFVTNVKVKTNYKKSLLTKSLSQGAFNPPDELKGLKFEYVLGWMGNGHNYYNPEGKPNYMYNWGASAGGSLLSMWADSEFKDAVGGHINYWSNLSITERQAKKMDWMNHGKDLLNSGGTQADYIDTIQEGDTVYMTGAIRFSKSQLQQCFNNPDQLIVFTDPLVFYSYRDIDVKKGDGTGTQPGGGSGSGDIEPSTETTTVDEILANPNVAFEYADIRSLENAKANYKYLNGNIKASVTGDYGIQPGKNSKLLEKNNHILKIGVFNGSNTQFTVTSSVGQWNDTNKPSNADDSWSPGEDSNNTSTSGGGAYGEKAPTTYQAEFEGKFDGKQDWMYTTKDGNLGFQLISQTTMHLNVLKEGVGDKAEYTAVEWERQSMPNVNGGWDTYANYSVNSKDGTTTADITGGDQEDVIVEVVNEKPTITVNTDKEIYQNSSVNIDVKFNDFEDDILLSEFELRDPNGVVVLKFSDGSSQKLQSTLTLSNTVSSVNSFVTDAIFTKTGEYIYTASVTDLASGTNFSLETDTDKKSALIRYTATAVGKINVIAANSPVAEFKIAKEMKVGEKYATLENCTDLDNTDTKNDVAEYYWTLCDESGKELKDYSKYFDMGRYTLNNYGSIINNYKVNFTTNNKYSSRSSYKTKNSFDFDVYLVPKKEAINKTFQLQLYVYDTKLTGKEHGHKSNIAVGSFKVVDSPDDSDATRKFQLDLYGLDGDAVKQNRAFSGVLWNINTGEIIGKELLEESEWKVEDSKGLNAKPANGDSAVMGYNSDDFMGFQIDPVGDYSVKVNYKNKEYTAPVTVKIDLNPSISIGLSEITLNNQKVDSLKAGSTDTYKVKGKAIVSSPDGDIVDDSISNKQYSIFYFNGAKSFVSKNNLYYYNGLTGTLSDGEETKDIKFKSGSYQTANISSRVYELFKEDTYEKALNNRPVDGVAKYAEQRSNTGNESAVYNFIPVVSLKYRTNADKDGYSTNTQYQWKGSQKEFTTNISDYYEEDRSNGTITISEEVWDATSNGGKGGYVTQTKKVYPTRLKKLPDDIGVLSLLSDMPIDIPVIKCYTGQSVTLPMETIDEKVETLQMITSVYRLSGLNGEWLQYNGDYTCKNTGKELQFNSGTSGIYRVDVTVIDEIGAMSDTASGYIRVYDPPIARLSTNPELEYNLDDEWNTKEIIRFDISSGLSGVDVEFGDAWHSMDFSKDCWEITPLDGQNTDDILVVEFPDVSKMPTIESVIGKKNNYTDADFDKFNKVLQEFQNPENLQKEISGTFTRTATSVKAINLRLGSMYRQFTFLKQGRYKIVYWGYDTAGKRTRNTAEEIILVDEDIPPMIEGTIPSLSYRTVEINGDNKTVRGADLILSGGTWNGALGQGRGSTRIKSVDGDKIYNVSVKESYDSGNNGKFATSKGQVTLGTEYGYTEDENGVIQLPKSTNFKDSLFGRYRYLKSNNLILHNDAGVKSEDEGRYTEAYNNNLRIRQYFNSSFDEEDTVYLQVADLNTSGLGQYKFQVDAVEVPSYPVIRYIDKNWQNYYNRATNTFKTEVDNIAPSATYSVREKPKVDIVVINNNGTDADTNYNNYANNLRNNLLNGLDTVVTVYKTNNIKAMYKDNASLDMIDKKVSLAWNVSEMCADFGEYESTWSRQCYIDFPVLYRDESNKLRSFGSWLGIKLPNKYGIQASIIDVARDNLTSYEGGFGIRYSIDNNKIINRVDKNIYTEFMNTNSYKKPYNSVSAIEVAKTQLRLYKSNMGIPLNVSPYCSYNNNLDYYTDDTLKNNFWLNNGAKAQKVNTTGGSLDNIANIDNGYYILRGWTAAGTTINGSKTELGFFASPFSRGIRTRNFYGYGDKRHGSIYIQKVNDEEIRWLNDSSRTYVCLDEKLSEMEDMEIKCDFRLFNKSMADLANKDIENKFKVVRVFGCGEGNDMLGWGVQYQGTVGSTKNPLLGQIVFGKETDDYSRTDYTFPTGMDSLTVFCNANGYTNPTVKEFLDTKAVTGERDDKHCFIEGLNNYTVVYVEGETINDRRYGHFRGGNTEIGQGDYEFFTSEQAAWNYVKALEYGSWKTSTANVIFKGTFSNVDNVYVLENQYVQDVYDSQFEERDKQNDKNRILGNLYFKHDGQDNEYYIKGKDGNGNTKTVYFGGGDTNFSWAVSKMTRSDYMAQTSSITNDNELAWWKANNTGESYAIGTSEYAKDCCQYFKDIYLSHNSRPSVAMGYITNTQFDEETSFYMYSIGSHISNLGIINSDDMYNNVANSMSIFNPGEVNKEALLKYEKGYFTVLSMKDLEANVDDNYAQDVKISIVGNRIKVTRNGKLIFNVTDANMLKGSRIAIDTCNKLDVSPIGLKLHNVEVTDGSIIPVEDVISSHEWRDGSDKFVVLAQPTDYPGIDNTTVTEDKENVIGAVISSNSNFIGLYSDQSKNWLTEVSNIANNNNKPSTVFNWSSDKGSNPPEASKFIKNLYSNPVTKTWLLVDTPLIWNTQYSDVEDDKPLNTKGYTGDPLNAERWRFIHNKEVLANNIKYTNNLGDYSNSGKWIPKSPDSFNQTGTYSVNYKRKDYPFSSNYDASNPLNDYAYFSKDYDAVN